jgi:hypothetical protein
MEGGIFRSNLRNFANRTINWMAGPLDDWAVHVDTNAPRDWGFRSRCNPADEAFRHRIRSVGFLSGG